MSLRLSCGFQAAGPKWFSCLSLLSGWNIQANISMTDLRMPISWKKKNRAAWAVRSSAREAKPGRRAKSKRPAGASRRRAELPGPRRRPGAPAHPAHLEAEPGPRPAHARSGRSPLPSLPIAPHARAGAWGRARRGPCSRGPAMEYIRTPKVGGLSGGGREGGMLSLSARGCPAGSWTASEGGAGGSLASPCALRGRPFSCWLTGLAGANLLSLGEGGRFVGCAVDAGVGRRERTLIVSWVTRFFYLFGSRLPPPPKKKIILERCL